VDAKVFRNISFCDLDSTRTLVLNGPLLLCPVKLSQIVEYGICLTRATSNKIWGAHQTDHDQKACKHSGT
jgi:hypothetical protein